VCPFWGKGGRGPHSPPPQPQPIPSRPPPLQNLARAETEVRSLQRLLEVRSHEVRCAFFLLWFSFWGGGVGGGLPQQVCALPSLECGA
jgi:hypothetical protein